MGIYGWELLALCHQPDKFGDQRHYDGTDLKFSIFHVISCKRMSKELRYLWVLWLEAPHGKSQLDMFPDHLSSGNGDITNLICNMTSQDHAIERSRNITSGSSHKFRRVSVPLMPTPHPFP